MLLIEATHGASQPSPPSGGAWLVASCHIVTAIIGAGVLGLPYAVSWLGLAAGIALLVAFFIVTLCASLMLTDVAEVDGVRYATYADAVRAILGERSATALGACQYMNLVLSCVGYTVAAGNSFRTVVQQVDVRCHHSAPGLPPHAQPGCPDPIWLWCLVFGAIEVLFSQIPSLESAWWSSIIGAAMSVLYSSFALGLGLAKVGDNQATLTGRRGDQPADKLFGVLNALGSIAFAYNFCTVLVEIQHTIPQPPPAKRSMQKSVTTGLGAAFIFYLAVGVTGYMALGDAVPGDVLTGFDGSPVPVVVAANVMVLMHMVPAYQVFCQPVFHVLEQYVRAHVKSARLLRPLALRLLLRTTYVVLTTLVAACMPFFSDIIGLVGALVFWPAAVRFPIAMYCKVHAPRGSIRRLLQAASVVMLTVSVLSAVGAVREIAVHVREYKFFGAT